VLYTCLRWPCLVERVPQTLVQPMALATVMHSAPSRPGSTARSTTAFLEVSFKIPLLIRYRDLILTAKSLAAMKWTSGKPTDVQQDSLPTHVPLQASKVATPQSPVASMESAISGAAASTLTLWASLSTTELDLTSSLTPRRNSRFRPDLSLTMVPHLAL
jgi:hypothetical protein